MENATPTPDELDLAKQIEADIKRLETVTQSTHSHRKKVIDKLSGVVDQMSFDPNSEKASEIEAKSNLISTLLKALNDTDDSHVKVVKLKKSVKSDQEQEDTLKNISRTVVEFAKQLGNAGNITPSGDETDTIGNADEKLDQLVDNSGIEILEGELEASNSTVQDVEVDPEPEKKD